MPTSVQSPRERGDSLECTLQDALAGNHEARNRLVEQTMHYIRIVIEARWRCERYKDDGYLDLFQDTVYYALRDFDHFHGNTLSEYLRWFRGIFLHRFQNYQKQRLRDLEPLSPEMELIGENETPSWLMMEHERDGAVEHAVGQLDAVGQEIIRLRYREGYGYEAIGKRLGRSADAVRKLHNRALQKCSQSEEMIQQA